MTADEEAGDVACCKVRRIAARSDGRVGLLKMQPTAGRRKVNAVCILFERTELAAHQQTVCGAGGRSDGQRTHLVVGGCWCAYDLGISAILALMALVQVEQVP